MTRSLAPAVAAVVLAAAAPSVSADTPVRFGRDVLPILSEHCFTCHGPDAAARKADLRLDTRDGALTVLEPGKVAASELVRRLDATGKEQMPPASAHRPLSAAQKATLRRWVEQGAVWGRHWAFEPAERPPLPAVKRAAWVRNPIDRFVLARLEREGLAPSAGAAKETLIRRVTFDLTGLPPTVAEVEAFLADTSPGAYEAVVDRLLASPRYGEHLAADWLDVARYADTNGYQNDFARTMWPWRDWVIAAFNANQPYDQFVVEQIAGDKLAHPTLAQTIATGFNRNNRTVTEAGSIDEEWRVENTVDRVETTATAFLGLTMGCCRCHDHKYDPVSQAEFYRFYGFFNSVNEKGVYTETRGNVPPLVKMPGPDHDQRVKQLTDAIAATGPAVRDALRRGIVHGRTVAGLVPAVKPWAAAVKAKAEYEASVPTVMVMEDTPKPRETFVLKRGQYDLPDKAKALTPGVPGCLPPLPAGAPADRLGLARWLVDPANPLTARVAVNRLWQRAFGTGLVKTAENFGLQGERPSHPELLDWLAAEFVGSGWDVKRTVKLIVTSAAYRQSSGVTPALLQRDPENRLLARGPRFRLPAEMVRDNALAVAGLLTEKIGGPSVKTYQPAGLWEELAGGAGEGAYKQSAAPDLYRRSLYVYRKRTVPHPTMATFDAPSREICQVKRARTNTPLQALELLNDPTYVEAARQLARLTLTAGGATPEARVTYAFRRATARTPAPAELRVLLAGLDRHRTAFAADPAAAKKSLAHGDSPVDAKLDPVEWAAYTAIAGVILNLDETITKE